MEDILYKPISKETIELGKTISDEEFISLLKRAKKAQIYVQSLMLEKGIDAWLAPVAPDFAPEDYEINYKGRVKLEDLSLLAKKQLALDEWS